MSTTCAQVSLLLCDFWWTFHETMRPLEGCHNSWTILFLFDTSCRFCQTTGKLPQPLGNPVTCVSSINRRRQLGSSFSKRFSIGKPSLEGCSAAAVSTMAAGCCFIPRARGVLGV